MEGFWMKVVVVEVPDGCWLWRGTLNDSGYGVLYLNKKQRRAHHMAWFLTYGDWPKYLMHRCDTPRCVNPAHLSEGSQRQNMADMTNKGRRTRGSAITWAKLTEERVIELRSLRGQGWSYNRLAARYGVSKAAVVQAVQRMTWQHI